MSFAFVAPPRDLVDLQACGFLVGELDLGAVVPDPAVVSSPGPRVGAPKDRVAGAVLDFHLGQATLLLLLFVVGEPEDEAEGDPQSEPEADVTAGGSDSDADRDTEGEPSASPIPSDCFFCTMCPGYGERCLL